MPQPSSHGFMTESMKNNILMKEQVKVKQRSNFPSNLPGALRAQGTRHIGTRSGTAGGDSSTGNESSNISGSRIHCSCGQMSVHLTLGIVTLGIDLLISCFAGRSSFSLEDSEGSRSSCHGGSCGKRLSCCSWHRLQPGYSSHGIQTKEG